MGGVLSEEDKNKILDKIDEKEKKKNQNKLDEQAKKSSIVNKLS